MTEKKKPVEREYFWIGTGDGDYALYSAKGFTPMQATERLAKYLQNDGFKVKATADGFMRCESTWWEFSLARCWKAPSV